MSDYFGQSPDGYQKPLYAASNFSDVVDKPTALTNLGAASKDDVLKAANPIGTIIAFYGSVAPYGYLPCSGQTVSSSTFPSLVTFLGGTTSATLPDLRGEFLRGWDNGRGIDAGRAIASWQKGSIMVGDFDENGGNAGFTITTLSTVSYAKALASAGLDAPVVSDYPTVAYVATNGSAYALTAGYSGVTRPRNISVLYCIKAYDTPVNAGTLNIGSIASEVALKTAISDFTGANQSLAANGWQKLPGGLIIQWGQTAVSASNVATLATLPVAWPSGFLQGSTTFAGSATVSSMGVDAPGAAKTQITLYQSSASVLTVRWIVIGY